VDYQQYINIATTDGGVLDLNFSSVNVQHSLFFENEATNNGSGGVFFGRKYTTSFTVSDTVFTYNSAGNGGVFMFEDSIAMLIFVRVLSLKTLLTIREVLWT
jgi:hypothetical protein